MSDAITRARMAHVLSIVGDAGLSGFEYDSGVNALSRHVYSSKKLRYSIAPSPSFNAEEFRYYLAYAARAGFVDAGIDQPRLANGEYDSEIWHMMLTLKGWRHIELYDKPILHVWGSNLKDNVPTIFVSVVTALMIAWLSGLVGISK